MATKGKKERDTSEQLGIEMSSSSSPEKPVTRAVPLTAEKGDRQEFFLPVTGFVWLHPEEVEFVNHPAFQRLARIYQLGQAHYVYRGATHKRIEHALGALHIVQRMIDAIQHNAKKAESRKLAYGIPLNSKEQRFVRLGALLHDIGHLAAGHTLEDELNLIGKHDADDRLDLAFGRRFLDENNYSLAELIDARYNSLVPDQLAKSGLSASDLVRLLVRKSPPPGKSDAYQHKASALISSSEIRWDICSNLVGNTICADLLDYLHRDWYHVGKPRPFDERILQYMEIRSAPMSSKGEAPQPQPSDRFVVSLGRRPKIRTDAISAILELLEWRYQLAESVLFHRTKLSAAAMLDRALLELWGTEKADQIVNVAFELSDEQLLERCLSLAGERGSVVASTLLRALTTRRLYADLKTVFADQVAREHREKIQQVYGAVPIDSRRASRNRASALAILEGDFGLPPGSLVMYCPTARMNAKIAEVRISVGDTVEHFNKYEENYGAPLSGGHLAAQLKRFADLWRVHFFIDRKLKKSLTPEILLLLQDAAEKLVLGLTDDTPELVTRALAQRLVALNESVWAGKRVNDFATVGHHRFETGSNGIYPTGFDCLRRFIDAD